MVDIDNNFKDWEKQSYKCPDCDGMTANMGLDFESPKKSDLKAWNHLKELYEAGVTFHSCGCSGPGYIPKDKNTLIDFLTKKKETYIENLRFWQQELNRKMIAKKIKTGIKIICFYLVYLASLQLVLKREEKRT
ncbi:hypothetical protein [Tenacibaculum amylolyticum]|uniref:hypothetical protein n=1 Tax=Tenacibaculum amylolyticum TaxID=104269 RepID=UPI003893DE11